MSVKLGLNAKLYINEGDYETPDWAEIANVRDLTLGDSMDSADATTRGSGGFKEEEPTLRGIEISFDMVNKAGDGNVSFLRTLYIGRTSYEFLAADGDIEAVGTHYGIRGTFKVHSFERAQALADAQMISVVLKPCPADNPVEDYEEEVVAP